MAKPLPIAGERPERADAVRNRERVLAAARARVAARRGADGTGVEGAQHPRGALGGAPPLGPGAPPLDRLLALLAALLDLLERHGDLLYAGETGKPEARYATGAYEAWHQHVAMLLGELGVDGDPDAMAHVVLAPLGAELYRHLRGPRGLDAPQVRDAVHAVVRRLAP